MAAVGSDDRLLSPLRAYGTRSVDSGTSNGPKQVGQPRSQLKCHDRSFHRYDRWHWQRLTAAPVRMPDALQSGSDRQSKQFWRAGCLACNPQRRLLV